MRAFHSGEPRFFRSGEGGGERGGGHCTQFRSGEAEKKGLMSAVKSGRRRRGAKAARQKFKETIG